MVEKKRTHEDVCIEPEFIAAIAVQNFSSTQLDPLEVWESIQHQIKDIQNGNLSQIEHHLYSQAIALNAMFSKMLRKAAKAEYVNQIQIFGQLALKAQAQSRATLMALAEIRNPNKATFIKQQNNAINQQVNNQLAAETLEKPKTTELISEETHETLDFSRTAAAIPIDTGMEPLEALYRPDKR